MSGYGMYINRHAYEKCGIKSGSIIRIIDAGRDEVEIESLDQLHRCTVSYDEAYPVILADMRSRSVETFREGAKIYNESIGSGVNPLTPDNNNWVDIVYIDTEHSTADKFFSKGDFCHVLADFKEHGAILVTMDSDNAVYLPVDSYVNQGEDYFREGCVVIADVTRKTKNSNVTVLEKGTDLTVKSIYEDGILAHDPITGLDHFLTDEEFILPRYEIDVDPDGEQIAVAEDLSRKLYNCIFGDRSTGRRLSICDTRFTFTRDNKGRGITDLILVEVDLDKGTVIISSSAPED